ncbi:AMP-binding protein [Pedobacter polysacchareus]|uniref:AMP-binding protein n=1 Tax=Pedobacter polysacchareus TaxID=2861973 RepID=UPI001C99D544|nr:AMP-binding protein [Pedobacter polysacchareus]
MLENNNLSQAFSKSFKAVGKRNCAIFLPKGDPLSEISVTGIGLHEKAVEMAYRMLERREELKHSTRPVLLAMSPGLDFVIAFIAGLYAGITIVPIPISRSKLQEERIRNIISDCNAGEIFCDKSGYEALKGFLDLPAFKLHCITDDREVLANNRFELPGFSFTAEDPAYIQYTSGSFKKPKGILLSHANVLHNLNLVGEVCGFNEQTISGSWLPHYHDMGLGTILVSLIHGSKIVLMSPLAFIQKPVRWLKMISEYKVTLSGAPAFAYNLCCNRIPADEIHGLDLSSWKLAFLGSEIVRKKVISSFYEKFSAAGLSSNSLFACYGMAEANFFIAGERAFRQDENLDSNEAEMIAPCFLREIVKKSIIIVDFITKKQLPDSEKGEIWIQSASLAKGYILPSTNQPIPVDSTEFAQTCEGQAGEWFKTGDLGYLDGDKLYVLGRQKDTIKVNGLNISAADVEWLAGDVNSNLNPLAAAAFRTSEEDDSKACLLIEVFSTEPMNIEDIKAQIRSKMLSCFSLELEHILILKSGTLDRTSSGKIRRYSIGQDFDIHAYEKRVLI